MDWISLIVSFCLHCCFIIYIHAKTFSIYNIEFNLSSEVVSYANKRKVHIRKKNITNDSKRLYIIVRETIDQET